MARVTFVDERTQLSVLVRPATFRDDIRRLAMQEDAMRQEYDDPAVLGAAAYTYPRLICCSTQGELTLDGEVVEWPPTSEQVLNMSVAAVNAWFDEAKTCNPTWFSLPDGIQLGDGSGEKKVSEK